MITADQILPPGADREDRAAWLAARRSGIGSSDVSAILGMHNRKSASRVYFEKVEGVEEESGEAARWGTLLEPVVRTEWTERTGIGVTPLGLHRSRAYPWMLYSADGITSDGGLYEGKTTTVWKAEEWEHGQVPDHAELQVQHGMAVMGLPHAWVAGLIGGQKLVWERVQRDDELIEMLIAAEDEFWHANVLAENPPKAGGSDADTEYLSKRFPTAFEGQKAIVDMYTAEQLIADYEAAAARKKVDEEAYKAAQNALREHIGTAEALVCANRTVATWTHTGNAFDEQAFRADHPELAEKYTDMVPVLDVSALRKDNPVLTAPYRNRVLRVKRNWKD